MFENLTNIRFIARGKLGIDREILKECEALFFNMKRSQIMMTITNNDDIMMNMINSNPHLN